MYFKLVSDYTDEELFHAIEFFEKDLLTCAAHKYVCTYLLLEALKEEATRRRKISIAALLEHGGGL